MKKTVLVALCLGLVSVEAQAISRYNSMSMSCARVRATIRSEGAVIMRWRSTTNPGVPRYGRYVANDRFCPSAEIAEPVYIPSSDRQSCGVLECHQYSPEDDDFFWLRRR